MLSRVQLKAAVDQWCDDGLAAIFELAEMGVIVIEQVKNRFYERGARGYKDMNWSLRFEGLICEVQLHLRAIIEVKEHAHRSYELCRQLGLAGDLPEEEMSEDAVEVAAPLGELGIIFENTIVETRTSRELVHCVKMVKPGSPLWGEILIGDVLLKVDGERTCLLDREEIVRLLVSKQEQPRVLTVKHGDVRVPLVRRDHHALPTRRPHRRGGALQVVRLVLRQDGAQGQGAPRPPRDRARPPHERPHF